MHPSTSLVPRVAIALLSAAAAPAAFAHHPTGGAVPDSAWHGLLSGLGHPVIGLDHLLFLVAAAVAVAGAGAAPARAARLLLAFVAAGVVGTLLRVPGPELPFAEAAVGASLLVLASLLLLAPGLRARARAAGLTWGLAGLGGLAHGYAYGEAVVGAEASPLAAYLAGLMLVQAGIALACFHGAHRLAASAPTGMARLRAALAAAVATAGAWTTVVGLAG